MTMDDMTAKWLSLTPNPLRIPVFYTLTKITNRHLLIDVLYQGVTALQKGSQLLLTTLAQKQASYLKDTTDFLNFIEKTKLPKNTIMILVSMDVTSLYTNIPQEEGITTVCEA